MNIKQAIRSNNDKDKKKPSYLILCEPVHPNDKEDTWNKHFGQSMVIRSINYYKDLFTKFKIEIESYTLYS